MSDRRLSSAGAGAALIVVLSLLGAAPALSAGTGFTYDDDVRVRLDPRLVIEGPADVARLLSDPYWGAGARGARLWRPVTQVTLGLERTLRGPAPTSFHRTNVALHAVAAVLVLLLLRRLLPPRLALFGAALFALHPVHGEAVGGIVGRAELLALGFTALGALLHLEGRARDDAPGWFAGAALAFLLAFGSKEIALTAPFLLALIEWALRGPGGGRPRAWPYALYAGALLAWFAARAAVVGAGLPAPAVALSPPLRVLLAAQWTAEAWGAMVWPPLTSGLYPYAPPDPSQPAVWGAVALDVALLALGVAWLTRPDRRRRILGLGAVGFFLALGPVSNLVPIGVVRADRLLYLPSLFACLLLAGLAGEAAAWTRARAPALRDLFWPALAGLVLGGFALRAQTNVRAWSEPVALWTTSLRRFPNDPRLSLLLGEALLNQRRPADALPHLQRAAAHPQAPPRAWARLAAAHLALGNLGEVERSLARPPSDDLTELLLRARYRLRRALGARDPRRRQEQLALGEAAARRAASRHGGHYDLLRVWANLLGRIPGRLAEAEQVFARACRQVSDPWFARFNRARIRLDHGEPQGALEDLRAVLASLRQLRDPSLASIELEARYDLADAALRVGRVEEARAALEALQRDAPAYRPRRVAELRARARRA